MTTSGPPRPRLPRNAPNAINRNSTRSRLPRSSAYSTPQDSDPATATPSSASVRGRKTSGIGGHEHKGLDQAQDVGVGGFERLVQAMAAP